MRGVDLATALADIGWSDRQFAERVGVSRHRLAKAIASEAPIPPDIEQWLRAVWTFHKAMPPPRWRSNDGA